ncbi:hypothetical protein [Streptococcus dentiloxodontae]
MDFETTTNDEFYLSWINESKYFLKNIILMGRAGCGKTYFLKELMNDKLVRDKYHIIHIDILKKNGKPIDSDLLSCFVQKLKEINNTAIHDEASAQQLVVIDEFFIPFCYYRFEDTPEYKSFVDLVARTISNPDIFVILTAQSDKQIRDFKEKFPNSQLDTINNIYWINYDGFCVRIKGGW